MRKPFKILDLFCKAGGASYGMFWVDPLNIQITGVDIEPQPRYPFNFIQADFREVDLAGYDFYWASPPCQRYSRVTPKKFKMNHPDLIPETRKLLEETGKPYVIENVVCSPLKTTFKLRGEMFGLPYRKERIFESNFFLLTPNLRLKAKINIIKRTKSKYIRQSLINWMNEEQFRNAVPPEYSYYILKSYLEQKQMHSQP